MNMYRNVGCQRKVLVVDDEPNAVKVLSAILSEDGYHVVSSLDVDRAINTVRGEDVDAIITDLKLPGKDGMYFFDYVIENHPDIPVIFLTAYGTVESAVSAMTRGAFYYFIKPPDYENLKGILARAVEQRCLKRELEEMKKRFLHEDARYRIVGNTQAMQAIFKTVDAVKDSDSTVLISGETGTGKELIARALHNSARRREAPFIAVNCGAIPKELMESELFGYEKGAFTGAVSRRIGKFEEAGIGTIFLDEIGELELSLQAKLLRVLQEREIERLGSSRKVKVDFRLISSTNRNLRKEVQEGKFREDLFYRINVIEVKVPPLRERKEDVPLLVSDFFNEACMREKKTLTLSDQAMRMLQNYSWPGNVRQLKNVIERAVVLARGEKVTLKELPEECLFLNRQPVIQNTMKTFKELEMQAVRDALAACKGNKSRAAKMLGISRKAFYKRLNEFPISIE